MMVETVESGENDEINEKYLMEGVIVAVFVVAVVAVVVAIVACEAAAAAKTAVAAQALNLLKMVDQVLTRDVAFVAAAAVLVALVELGSHDVFLPLKWKPNYSLFLDWFDWIKQIINACDTIILYSLRI